MLEHNNYVLNNFIEMDLRGKEAMEQNIVDIHSLLSMENYCQGKVRIICRYGLSYICDGWEERD